MRLLDTNIFNALRDKNPTAIQRLISTADSVRTSTIVVEEVLMDGFLAENNKIRSGKSRADITKLHEKLANSITALAQLGVMGYSAEAEQKYQELKGTVKGLGAMDGRIAAHALVLGAVLVTQNIQDFERVPGLELESWL